MCDTLKNEFQLCEMIGRSRFGVVYRCFSSVSDQFFTCKSIDKRLLSDCDLTDRDCLDKEPKILYLLSGNPNILQIYRTFEDDNFLHIITDLCDSPDLFDRVSKSTFTESEITVVFKPLINSISYCHRLGIAHRDIKPDNVLFDSSNKLKLADFVAHR